MEQFTNMVISVVLGLALVIGFFVGANKLLDQTRNRWWWFTAGVGLLVGLLVGAVLQHNGWFPGGTVGVLLGGVLGLLVGGAIGRLHQPALPTRVRLGTRLRPVVFVGPAVLFVTLGLIIPSLRTMLLSLKEGRRGDGGFTLDQYRNIFTNSNYFNVDNVGSIFTSRLFVVGLAAVVLAGVAAWASAQRFRGGTAAHRGTLVLRSVSIVTGGIIALMLLGFVESLVRTPNQSSIYDGFTVALQSPVTWWILVIAAAVGLVAWSIARIRAKREPLDWSAPSSSLLVTLAVIVLLFAALTTLQAVIWNNLWWVVTVAGLSTVLGLLLAILADQSKREKWAKTLIFLPMAISMVGAAVIWDFMFEFRPTGTQTGLVNAILQGIGFAPRGFFINASMIPWNNFWIMIIMIWIQTGFAMVVLSAAIKAVPDELIEAARVDGATKVQVFWRIVVPQIKTTIIVVLVTLIIIVMKVFDLVKATTNGANQTNVLANVMFDELRNRNFALSSAFAVLILVLTLPVMIFNIRRTQKELV